MDYTIKYLDRTAGVEVVTLEQAKANARIDYDDEDNLLELYIASVTDEIEKITGTVVIDRAVEIGFSGFAKKIPLPVTPVSEITEVAYYDKDDQRQVMEAEAYSLIGIPDSKKVLFASSDFPALSAEREYPVEVKVKAGYDNDKMPDDFKRAALLMFGAAETYREDMPIQLHRSAYNILKHRKKY